MDPTIRIHKQRVFSLVFAGIIFFAMMLPWIVVNYGGIGNLGGGRLSYNGFELRSFLTFIGMLGVVICSLSGDKSSRLKKNLKLTAGISFCVALTGTLIVLWEVKGNKEGFGIRPGIGLWISILAGVTGLLLILKSYKKASLRK